MNTAVLGWAETCLKVWGSGAGERGMTWLGFSSTNVIYRIMTEGVGASAATAPTMCRDLPEDIAAAGVVIDALDESIKEAIWQRYVIGRSDRIACRKLNLSRAEYRRRLQCALWAVAGGLVMKKSC